jgi:hypothetical protein
MNTPQLLNELASVIDKSRSELTWDDIYAATMLLEQHIKIHWENATRDQLRQATQGDNDDELYTEL